jgi:hypothetical protein
MKNSIARAASVALAAGLLLAGSLAAQGLTVHKFVVVGDSYGAGFGANCLVTREQKFSYSNQIATSFGIADFQQPTVSDPGIPTCNGVKTLVPFTYGPISDHTGVPTNLALARPYDNLSVPGFKIADVSDTVTDNGGLADLVLRGHGSALNQALALNPDFVMVSIVGNDILPAGGAGFFLDGVTVTPLPLFTAKYNAVAAALKASGRNGILLGTGYPFLLPLVSALTRFVPDPVTGKPILGPDGKPIPLLGPGNAAYPCPGGAPACPLPEGTVVTLVATAPTDPALGLGGKSLLQAGFGIPCAVAQLPMCNQPLPDGSFDAATKTVHVGVLFYPDEVATLIQRIHDMNAVIQAAAAANGFKYFDTYAFGANIVANGYTAGGIHISNQFVTGGFFAFGNAVHFSTIGYTIAADAIIQTINSAYGSNFPRPNVNTAFTTPDAPAAAPAALTPQEELQLFDYGAVRRLFEEFPLQSSEFTIVLPGADAPVGRAPVHPTAPRGRAAVEDGRPRVEH